MNKYHFHFADDPELQEIEFRMTLNHFFRNETGSEFEIESDNEDLTNAIKLALTDLTNKESSLYQDVYTNFAKYRAINNNDTLITFASKLINSIGQHLETNPDSIKMDAYIYFDNHQDYYSFNINQSDLELVFSNNDVELLSNIGQPGYRLLKLGPYILVNHVLGFYYEYLARWCGDPDNSKIRDLKGWMIGPH